MHKIKIYFSILLLILTFSDSFSQEVELHNIGKSVGKILGFLETLDPTKECENSTTCRMAEKCIISKCRNPCPGSCGIDAICTVVEHEPICRCPKCYEGDALIKCEPYRGLRRMICQWDKLIERFNTINSVYIQQRAQQNTNK